MDKQLDFYFAGSYGGGGSGNYNRNYGGYGGGGGSYGGGGGGYGSQGNENY